MAIKLRDGQFACSICGHKYSSSQHADGCRDSHELLYIPMSKTELNRLLNAIILEDFKLVPHHLLETLRKYSRYQVTEGGKNV